MRRCSLVTVFVAVFFEGVFASVIDNSVAENATLRRIDVNGSLLHLAKILQEGQHNKLYTSLKDVFTPEFKAKLLNVSTKQPKCSLGIGDVIGGILTGEFWAIQVVDSWGRPRSGLTDGNLVWPGSFHQCTKVVKGADVLGSVAKLTAKYCWIDFDLDVPFFPLPDPDVIMPPLKIAICVPDGCSETQLYELFSHISSIPVVKKYAKLSKVSCMPAERPPFWNNLRSVASLLICLFFAMLISLASLYHLYFLYKNFVNKRRLSISNGDAIKNDVHFSDGVEAPTTNSSNNISELSDNAPILDYDCTTHTRQPTNDIIVKIILAFAATKNLLKILDLKPRQNSIDCINCIRVITLFWIIITQTYVIASLQADNLLSVADVLKTIPFEVIAQSILGIDTFFLISGLLVTYLYLQNYQQNDGKTSWFKFYLYRYLRLTPVYILFILLIDDSLARYITTGPFWPKNGFEGDNCKKNWWWNLLYINNFTPSKYMCAPHTWYLANDMQFFLISPVILFALTRFFPAGMLISGILILVSWITSGCVSSYFGLQADLNLLKLMPNTDAYYDVVDHFYDKPYVHLAPYVIGMLTGWLLHMSQGQAKLKPKIVVIGWCLSTVCNCVLVFGLYRANQNLNLGMASLYHALSRTAWSFGIAWIIFACSNGYGGIVNIFMSLRIWRPLSRLSYCAYLVHLLVINISVFSRDITVHFSHLFMIYYSFGNIIVSLLAALILSLMFEMPFLELMRISPKAQTPRE